MDRDSQAPGGEDAAENRQHVDNAAANRDALEAQNRRTRATVSDAADTPVTRADGTGSARDPDNAGAMREVEQNREALEAQNRRVAASKPADVNMTGPDASDDR